MDAPPPPPPFNPFPSNPNYQDPATQPSPQWGNHIQFVNSSTEHPNHPLGQPPPLFQQIPAYGTPLPPTHPQGGYWVYPNNNPIPPSSQSTQTSTLSRPGGGKKNPNWTNKEDEALCKAWVNVGSDPVVGADQSARTFWEKVHAEFSSKMTGTCREKKGVESRWGVIYPEVTKWSAAMHKMGRHIPSGFNADDQLGAIREFFRGEHGHYFKFEHCWKVLRNTRKWRLWSHDKAIAMGLVQPNSSWYETGGNSSQAYTPPSNSASQSVNIGLDSFHESCPESNSCPLQSDTPITATPQSAEPNPNSSPIEDETPPSQSGRPVGRKQAKNQRKRKARQRTEASSTATDRIIAGFAMVKESQQSKWQKIDERAERDSLYSRSTLKYQMMKDRAAIEETIIRSLGAIHQLEALESLTEKQATEIEWRRKKIADMDSDLEELRSITFSPARREGTAGEPPSGSGTNLSSRFDEEAGGR